VDDVAAVLLDTVNTPTEFNDVWNIEAPVIPIPPEVTRSADEWLATPENKEVDPNTAAPVIPNPDPTFKLPETPKPPTTVNAPFVDDVEFVLEENVAFPVTPRVEDAVNAPTEVNEVWKVEAPVIPIPPEVTSNAAECEATPENKEVEPNTAAPLTPRPVPAFIFPETPSPPTRVTAPFVEDVEFVFELNTLAPLTVNPPVTPKPPAVIFTLEARVATPVTDNVEEAVNAPTEVSDVWNTDAPVIPIPPEVTSNEVLKDLTPAKVCGDVVTSPISPTPALGMLNVCVDVREEILNVLPPDPTANVCVDAVKPPRDCIPDEPAPAPVPQERTPEPLVVNTWPFVPSAAGKVQILLEESAGAVKPT
jgi:hypothetical protein